MAGGSWKGTGLVWLSALTLLAFILRVFRVDFQALWWDEGWTVFFAAADVPTMLAGTAIDIHPPFYYLVLHFWTLVIGSSAASVRLFSVMTGTLTIPVVFLVGRRLFGRKVAVSAALIMAVAPFHIYYSQEARMYALVTLLVLASISFFLSLLERQESGSAAWVRWALYVFVTSLAMYTQYYAAFIPVALTLFLLVRSRRYRAVLPKWILALIVLVLSYVPWLLYAGPKLVAYVSNKLVKEGDAPVGPWTYLQRHLVAFSVGHLSEARTYLSWIAMIFIALALLGLLARWAVRDRHQRAEGPRIDAVLLAAACLFVPLTLGYAVNLRYPFTSPAIERLFLLSAPPFYLLVAAGLSWVLRRARLPWSVVVGLVFAVCALPLVDHYSSARYAGEDYRPVVDKVQSLALPEDVVVAVHPWQIGYFHAYYEGELPSLYLTPKDETDVTSERWAADPALMARDLDGLLAGHRFLWFPAHQTLGRIVESDVERHLFENYYPILSEWFSESTRLSSHAAVREATQMATGANFGDKISLLSYRLAPGPQEAGWGAALVDLNWRIVGELQGRYQIALRLVDEQSRVWAIEDREPLGGLRPFHEQPEDSEIADHQALLVPAGTPPGLYRLQMGLYRLENGEWLDVLNEQGTPQGVEMTLGEVEVRTPAVPPPEQALFIQYPQEADFSSAIRFLGYSLGGVTFQPGDALDLTLFWRALADLREDYVLSLRLEDEGGTVWARVEGPPSGLGYPTSRWTKDQLVRGLQRLMVPGGVPAGRYRIALSLHGSADGKPVSIRRCLWDRGESHVLGTVEVQGRVHQTQPPSSIRYPMSAQLGESVRFLGYDLDTQEVTAGGSVRLTLYWQALAEMDTSYSVFNHLIDGDNRIWGQRDGLPGGGALPTSSWILGEYVVDEYDIPVLEDTPPGQYVIETGMYDVTTMVRLPVLDAQGAVVGDRILLEDTPIYVR